MQVRRDLRDEKGDPGREKMPHGIRKSVAQR
jgi:hypothetical protein